MNRRFLLQAALGSSAALALPGQSRAAAPATTPANSDLKITRVRVFNPANGTNLDGRTRNPSPIS